MTCNVASRLSAGISIALWVAPPPLLAQTCHAYLSSALVGATGTSCHGGGCPDSHVHIRVLVPGGALGIAARAAMAQWNQVKHLTNTVFDEDNSFPHLRIEPATYSADDVRACGAYNSDRITYRQQSMEAVAQNDSAHAAYAAYTFAHELGHFLGLAESYAAPGTVMNNLIGSPGQTCVQVFQNSPPATLTVQQNDAVKAGECSMQARAQNPFAAPPPQMYSEYVPDGSYCTDYWLIEHYYYCNSSGGCYYGFSYSTYLGRQCP